MKKLKTAVIGLGRIGWNFHIKEIASHRGFILEAVVDPVEERRKDAEKAYGIRTFTDSAELYGNVKPDLAVIATPTPFHMEQTLEAFSHGADVFCDKPLALTYEDASRLADAAAKSKRKLMVYQPHRARAEVAALKDILSKGMIGEVFLMKRGVHNYVRRNDWQAFTKYGGGMLNNYGAHYIDQLLYLSGGGAKKVSCALRRILSLGDADDVVKAVIETESGIILDIDINTASASKIVTWLILGKYGSVEYDWDKKSWIVRSIDPAQLGDAVLSDSLAALDRVYPKDSVDWEVREIPFADYQEVNFYDQCYRYFVQGKKPFVPLEDTLEVMRVLKLCREDARSGGFTLE